MTLRRRGARAGACLSFAILAWGPAPGASRAHAQPAPPGADARLDSARSLRGERLRVALVTFGAGDEVWDYFGHNAIEIRDTVTGRDIAYNWGMFDFDQPHFVSRFLTGETSYWTEPINTDAMVDYYVRINRSVRVQQLALTPVERAALAEFVDWNSQDANKYYRYDYYSDNCATRVRDALDRVLGGRLKAAIDSGTHGRTWRSETERLTASDLPVYAGISIALGRSADHPLTPWQESFLPERLAQAAGPLVLRDASGRRYRLVSHDTLRFAAERVPLPIDPPERVAMAALIGLALAGIIAMLTDSRLRLLRVVLSVGVALWYAVGGILGTLLLLAGTVTRHAAYMGHNTTLLELNPLLLAAAFLVPASLARSRSTRGARWTSLAIAVLSILGLLAQFVPGIFQHSGVVLAVSVPVNVMIAIAVMRVTDAHDERRATAAAALSRAA